MEAGRRAFKMLTGKPIVGMLRRRLEDSTRMNLKEIGVSPKNWTESAQDRDY